MVKITDLPQELILQIAHNLKGKDLISLISTARGLRDAAEEALYESPPRLMAHINDSYVLGERPVKREGYYDPEDACQVLYLVRTLMKRPELAGMIKALHVELPMDRPEAVIPLRSKRLLHNVSFLVEKDTSWFEKLETGYVGAWVGLLIALAPKLERLTLCHCPLEKSTNRQPLPVWNSLEHMLFGINVGYSYGTFVEAGEDIPYVQWAELKLWDLSVVPGLRNIKHLAIDVAELNVSWLMMKSVQSLDLPHGKLILPGGVLPPDLRLQRFSTIMPAHVLQSVALSAPWGVEFRTRIPELQGLTNVEIRICNTTRGFLHAIIRRSSPLGIFWPCSFANFFNIISAAVEKLEEFRVTPIHDNLFDCGIDWLDCVEPLQSMEKFSSLKRLSLPQDAFVKRKDPTTFPTHPTDMLPLHLSSSSPSATRTAAYNICCTNSLTIEATFRS